jgi:hypothetical protein
MFRWLLVIFVALLVINWLAPFLGKLGIGRLPGDFRFKIFGLEFFIPLASTVLLSVLAGLIAKLV